MNLCIDLYDYLDSTNEEPRTREEQLKLLLSAVLATHFDKHLASLQFAEIEATTRLPFMQNRQKKPKKRTTRPPFRKIRKDKK
jgi:hypothetical protein